MKDGIILVRETRETMVEVFRVLRPWNLGDHWICVIHILRVGETEK